MIQSEIEIIDDNSHKIHISSPKREIKTNKTIEEPMEDEPPIITREPSKRIPKPKGNENNMAFFQISNWNTDKLSTVCEKTYNIPLRNEIRIFQLST